MPFDVSVIMPAYQACATVARAAVSVLAQTGVTAELVLCADDDLDYGALVPAELRATGALTLCRTPAPRSGPSAARNIALSHARADIIACLDADDAYVPDRLARLLPLVERHGVATGPTREIDPRLASPAHRQAARWRRPLAGRGHLRAAHAVLAGLSQGEVPAGLPADRVRRGRDPQRRPFLRHGCLSVRRRRRLHLSREPQLAHAVGRAR